MLSEVRYEIKNFITCYLTWNIDTNLGWFVRNEHEHWSWLIWLKMEILVHGLILQTSDNVRSKEKKECYSLILIESIITLLYIGFGKYF